MTTLERVKDKDFINANLTYGIEKLTKGNQALGSGQWSLIAESIDPTAVRQFIIQYNIAMKKQYAAHPELANDQNAQEEVNAALFKESLPLLQKVNRLLNYRLVGKIQSENLTLIWISVLLILLNHHRPQIKILNHSILT